jgi:hypothetical protein
MGSGWICELERRGWSQGSESTDCSVCALGVPIFLNTTEKSILPKLPVLPATGHTSGHYYGATVRAVQGRKIRFVESRRQNCYRGKPGRPATPTIAARWCPVAAQITFGDSNESSY